MSGFGKVRRTLRSSHLEAATFNPENLTMDIEFRSGSVYRYEHVTAEVFLEFISAPIPGAWFAENIRRRKLPTAYTDITGSLCSSS